MVCHRWLSWNVTEHGVAGGDLDRPGEVKTKLGRANRTVRHATKRTVMRRAWIKMDEHFSLPTQLFDEPLFDFGLCCMTLFQVPITRQGQVKVDVMAVPGTPGAQVVQI